jgi:uncharacterized RmlC-like cupin family protein
MSDSSAIRIIHPREFDGGTLQTPGSERLAAVAPQLGVETTLWGGLFEVKQGARTGIHHHGEQQTIAYVLSGICKVRWGANGEFAACAEAGDFIHVPAFLPHMEINPSDSQPFRRVVVRSTQLRSWSIFQRTRGDRFQTPGKWPRVRHLTMTRDDGSKPGTKAPSHG